MNVLTDWFKNKKFSADLILVYIFIIGFFGMPLGTALPIICGIAASLVWIFSGKIIKIKYLFLQTWYRPVLLLIILPWFGLIYTLDLKGLGVDYALKTHYWIYGLIIASIANIYKPEKYIQAFLLGLTVNAFVGGLQFLGIYPPVNGWYCGIGRGYSTLSAYLIIGILISSFYFRKANNKKEKLYSVFLMVFYFFHLSILDSRSGYLSFLAMCPMIVRNIFGKAHILKLICACIVIIGVLFASPVVQNRFKLSIDQLNYHLNAESDAAWGKTYSDQQDRFYMWYGAVKIFMENPVFGVGTGGYRTSLKKSGKPDDPFIAHPHNDILYMAVSYGLPGIFAFIWLFTEIIKNSWPQKHTISGYFILSTAFVILISGLFNGQIIDAGMAFLLSVTVGLQQSFPNFKKT